MEKRNKVLFRVEYSSTIALFSYIVWASIYGYFALRFDSDPEVCMASDSRDTKEANAGTADSVNVGARFRTTFNILFYLSLLMLTLSLFISLIKVDGLRKFFVAVGIFS